MGASAHAPRGSEVLAERESHIVLYECAGASVVAGAQLRTLEGVRGVFTPTQVVEGLRDPTDPHEPRSSLVCVENTHNHAGGTVWTRAQTRDLAKAAHEHGLKVHVDGARLFNSAVAQDVAARSLVDSVDSVMFCLSKGLSAPVGSVVAGTKEFIGEALRARKLFGGGMRQAGVIAAAGLVALDTMVDRLAEDHANCRRLAAGLAKLPGIAVDLDPVQTNILFTDVSGTGQDARKLAQTLDKMGVRGAAPDARRIRFVSHRHVTREDVDWAIAQVASALGRKVRARA